MSDDLQNLPGTGVAACEAGIDEPVMIKTDTATVMNRFPPMRIFLLETLNCLEPQSLPGTSRLRVASERA